MQPLVSILIPAYNAQEWIAQTLQSAVDQTWARKEIIVVDDGSKDSTLEVARRFESASVRVVTQPNQGAATARNACLSFSQGDYIQWLDADDLLNPGKIEHQMARAEREGSKRVLLSSPWGSFMYRPSRARFLETALWADLPPLEWLVRKMEQNLHMQTATWLTSRELTEAAGPWNKLLLSDDDGEYFARVLLASERVAFVPESKVFYRVPQSSNLSYIGMSNKKMDAQWLSMDLNIGYVRSLEDSPRVRAGCVHYLQTWFPNFYPHRPDLVEKAQAMAAELGGQLDKPQVSWKYSWIGALLGAEQAKRASVYFPRVRWSLVRSWDNVMFRLESREGQ